MKKLDFIIIGFTLVLLLLAGILLIKNNEIEQENVAIEVIVQSEKIYTLSLEENGNYKIKCKDNILILIKEDKVLYSKEIKSKDFENSFQIINQKVEMKEATCDGKDCTKMYISKSHLIPIICTNGIVLNPIGHNGNVDVIV